MATHTWLPVLGLIKFRRRNLDEYVFFDKAASSQPTNGQRRTTNSPLANIVLKDLRRRPPIPIVAGHGRPSRRWCTPGEFLLQVSFAIRCFI